MKVEFYGINTCFYPSSHGLWPRSGVLPQGQEEFPSGPIQSPEKKI